MSLATVSAMRLAITPPEVSTPHPPSSKPTRRRSHDVTSSSTKAATGPAWKMSTPWLTHCARTSPAIDIGSGGGVK
jgi:hypothetical protein